MPGPGPVAEVETVPPPTPGVGPALKPKERSSVARPPAAAEDATQSAKAPVSEGSLLLVATTANSSANKSNKFLNNFKNLLEI